MDKGSIGLIIGGIVFVLILVASFGNREDLARFQQLKNKRRFSGRRLTPEEQGEYDQLARKYWWY